MGILAIIAIIMAVINPITRNNMGLVSFKLESLWALILLILCLGILWLAVPRFVASLYALYPESVLKQEQDHVPAEVYQKSLTALDKALAWDDNPEYWQDKSLCYLALVNFENNSVEQEQLQLSAAQLAIKKGLGISPVDAFSWYRLALVYKRLNFNDADVTDALRLSLYAGRVEPELALRRLMLAYPYQAVLSAEEQAQWLKQVAIEWQFTPKWQLPINLVSFVIENPSAKAWVESAFMYDDEQLNLFKQAYDRAIKKSISATVH